MNAIRWGLRPFEKLELLRGGVKEAAVLVYKVGRKKKVRTKNGGIGHWVSRFKVYRRQGPGSAAESDRLKSRETKLCSKGGLPCAGGKLNKSLLGEKLPTTRKRGGAMGKLLKPGRGWD